ncbi:putative protein OS=Tsukamurella paurometabola (strain ATCC 8368 / DSM / CCUG 35730 /CIP 100753 / JCM 10117 / KCTC 9821 / NBRC 16120 / NCIMB 702349/ NCTC 13040) OX=521096 GN=Tpau_3098 PE=4 SV=1 [Tsukamurella paurometabola]|uniref:Uncharacterized protein n=1 Tax=Tsukamurella paurometabola (strain ATCC 8368 / DSM 20162 / CCUG 35730 / CIP 100753 / JCM 10117 / KCTC 9821 / NBRC 16120 / NCIMB 702349 / NCTC 13040) TaxID=521096 RepID=D5UUX0_TSUPD|nr:hypothetical protein [Tsukamurella paurometabola]ADG79688.1 conserved hypothetical protein [Tsukamurella paurometabola DSM 20162]SUP36771.1 Uncharacterised protein [Tsukamurella paurometabola]
MLLHAAPQRRLGAAPGEAALRIAPIDAANEYSDRTLFHRSNPVFGLSFWCGTCPFLFERTADETTPITIGPEPLAALERGLDSVSDEVIDAFAPLLPIGDYVPLLIEVHPELVDPRADRDYFTHEQLDTWATYSLWGGRPHDPRCSYYRTYETAIDPEAHLYEFAVPMVPPAWNDEPRVRHYLDLLAEGTTPTAVALSILDVRQPAVEYDGSDYYSHWALTHYLLDGHHKFEAAVRAGAAVRVLTLVTVDESGATPQEVARLGELLARPRSQRLARH